MTEGVEVAVAVGVVVEVGEKIWHGFAAPMTKSEPILFESSPAGLLRGAIPGPGAGRG